MIYKFKSKAAGDLIMLGPHGDHLLRLLGREPSPRGIVEPAAMADARARLQAALAEVDAAAARAAADAADAAARGDDEPPAPPVGLRQRLWPMLQMLERAEAAGEPIVWGV